MVAYLSVESGFSKKGNQGKTHSKEQLGGIRSIRERQETERREKTGRCGEVKEGPFFFFF